MCARGPPPLSAREKLANWTSPTWVAMAPFIPFLYATRPSNTAGTCALGWIHKQQDEGAKQYSQVSYLRVQ
jgi:hypothetical protein